MPEKAVKIKDNTNIMYKKDKDTLLIKYFLKTQHVP